MRLNRHWRFPRVADAPDKALRCDLGDLREILPDGCERGREQRGVLGIVDSRDAYHIRHGNAQIPERPEKPSRLVVVAAGDGVGAAQGVGTGAASMTNDLSFLQGVGNAINGILPAVQSVTATKPREDVVKPKQNQTKK